MLDIFWGMRGYYVPMMVMIVLGAAGRIVEWASMQRLLRASRSVKESENHDLIRQMKTGYVNAYRLNYGVRNTRAFIEKYLSRHQVMHLPSSFLATLDDKMMLLCGIFCIWAVVFAARAGRSVMELAIMAGFGISAVLMLRLVGSFFSSKSLKKQFMSYMVDYFENVLQNRLHNHRKDVGKGTALGEERPAGPRAKEEKRERESVFAASQTAAARPMDELVVEEIIKEFFP